MADRADNQTDRHPMLAHQFAEMKQQHEASKLGLWLFIFAQLLLFAGLISVYVVFRAWYPAMFVAGHETLTFELGVASTAVLIISAVAVAMAGQAMRQGTKCVALSSLVLGIVMGLAFLVISYMQYSDLITEGLLPGTYFTNTELIEQVGNPHIYFGFYFGLTGLHLFYIIAGMAVMVWTLGRMVRGDFCENYYYPVELAGIYWNLLVIIWIFLFPLLYLVR
jgi:cytochrome c oxidase subunit 3